MKDPRDSNVLVGDSVSGKVFLNGRLLRPERSRQLVNKSPSGFAWGYGGSGPAQLALAVLLELSEDPDFALVHYQTFKERFIARLPEREFLVRFSLAEILPEIEKP